MNPTKPKTLPGMSSGVRVRVPSVEERALFGRGYTVGFFAGFALIIASFVAIARADDAVARTSAAGYLLMSFGASFVFGFTYTIVVRGGTPWSYNLFGRFDSGVLDRKRSPAKFWALTLPAYALFLAMLLGGAWIRLNSKSVAALAQQYARDHADRDRRR